ncbi:MAG TPA: N-acetylmuramic acid 6-phosphate etherase [Phycisphaerae bacterium]|nr:N-acetylmuramic acid 6-phosphate etherase [Phycisphaerae bacterium]
MEDRGHLLTEQRNERSGQIDRMPLGEAFDVMAGEDATIARAVAAAKGDICRAVELVVSAFERGGRLIYVGAGTSGRLGVLDAAECPPTFLSDPEMVQGVIAGGWEALRCSIEGAEDDPDGGVGEMDGREVGANDVVFGIATGGTTPFVQGALRRAGERGAKTVFLACVPVDQVTDEADVSIRVLTGPEVVTGSTRLKAGIATKLVLNMVSTLSMIGIGKVYENLMVDMNAKACAKLIDRATRVLQTVTGLDRGAARDLLDRADGRVKTAIVMHARGVDRGEAEGLLEKAKGHIRPALDG